MNRTIEPYRGGHIFIRTIPEILKIDEDMEVIIVGETRGDMVEMQLMEAGVKHS